MGREIPSGTMSPGTRGFGRLVRWTTTSGEQAERHNPARAQGLGHTRYGAPEAAQTVASRKRVDTVRRRGAGRENNVAPNQPDDSCS